VCTLRSVLRPQVLPITYNLLIVSLLPEGRGFDSRWRHWDFSLTEPFRLHYGPAVDSSSVRNKYQEYLRGEGVLGKSGQGF
jgi:hypothetical protein